MKKIPLAKNVSNYITRNKWQLLIFCICLILGVFLGSLYASMMGEDNFNDLSLYIKNFVSAYSLQSSNSLDILKFSLYNNIKVILFIWFFGIWIYTIPLSFVCIAVKGYKLGFAMAAFVRIFGLSGTVFSAVSLLPQILFYVPALIFYGVSTVNLVFFRHRLKGQRITSAVKNQLYLKSFLYLLSIILISLLSSTIDAFIIPAVLKPICSFLNR